MLGGKIPNILSGDKDFANIIIRNTNIFGFELAV